MTTKQQQIELLQADNKRLRAALEEAERRMSKSPQFNPWDLGPTPSLQQVRAALRIAPGIEP